MVGTDGEGMEETDGEVLDLVAVRCCLLVAHQCCRASLSPCPLAMLLSSRVVVVGSLWSHPVSQRGGLGGRWDGGYLPSINNDERRMSFVILVATSLSATWHLHSPLAAGGRFHLLAVVSIHAWSFPSVHGRFPLWAVVCVRSQSFSFVAVIFIRLRSWPVVYVRGRSFAFVGGQFRCISWLAVGAVLWLSWAASFCGHCGG